MFCSKKVFEISHSLLPSIEFRTHQLFIEVPEPWSRVYSLSPNFPKELLPVVQEFSRRYPSSSISLINSQQSDPEIMHVIYFVLEGRYYHRYEYRLPKAHIADNLKEILFGHNKKFLVPSLSERDYFVCTHTSRDACCGKFGLELYKKLKEDSKIKNENIRIFSSSHIGGHRYAPTLLEGPTMNCWGQLDFDSAKQILLRKGNLSSLIKHYRGSASLSSPYFQVAEGEIMKKYGWEYLKLKNLSYSLQDQKVHVLDEVFTISQVSPVELQANCNEDKKSLFPQYLVDQ